LAENPLATIARVLGGVVLMDGRLGHQVLGQLLVMNTNEVAIAGASVVVAATSGQRNAVGQIVLRTAIPALAVRAILRKTEERIDRKATLLAERELRLEAELRAATLRATVQRAAAAAHLRQQQAATAVVHDQALVQVAALRKDRSSLRGQLTRLRNRLRQMQEEAGAPKKKLPKKRR
jgi:hypothetical protein